MAKVKETTKQVLKENGAGKSTKAKVRTTEELILDLHPIFGRDSKKKFTSDEITLLNGVSAEELAELIDVAAEIEEDRRSIEKLVKTFVEPTKSIIREIGRLQNKKSLTGNKAIANITKSTKSVITSVTDFIKLLIREKKKPMVDSLLNVRLTDAKKYLGEDLLTSNGLMKFESEEFGSVSIKKLQK